MVITSPTPHGVIVGAAVLRVGITVAYLSVAFRATVAPEMPLAIVPTSKTCVCLPHSKGWTSSVTVVSYQFSEVLITSPKPPWLHLSGAKVVSKGPGACTETLSLSAYSAYLWGI